MDVIGDFNKAISEIPPSILLFFILLALITILFELRSIGRTLKASWPIEAKINEMAVDLSSIDSLLHDVAAREHPDVLDPHFRR